MRRSPTRAVLLAAVALLPGLRALADPPAEAPPASGQPASPAPEQPAAAAPQPLEQRVKELEETVRQLQETIKTLQQQQARPPEAGQVEKIVDEKLKKQKPLAGWQNGFFLESPDGNFRLRLRGFVQADQRAFFAGGGTGVDSFYLRRVRPILDGTVYKHFDFRIAPDFAGGSATLFDAYLDYHQYPQAVLRVGKFKEPVSLERLQGGTDLHFIERSIAQNLAPNRDVGIQLSGDLLKKRLTYYLAAFDGVNDSLSGDGDPDSDKDFAGRLFYQPFAGRKGHALQEFGFGLGASVGERHEALGAQYRSAGRSSVFRYLNGALGDGRHARLAPGFYLFRGPLGLMAEYIASDQEVRRLGVRDTVRNTGYFGQVTYVLTGEKGSFRGVTPRRDFDPSKNHWGAFELGARYSRLDIDDTVFRRGFANPNAVAGGADEFSFGLNWYLNRAVKVQLNYVRTLFDHPIPFGSQSRDHEDVFLSRFQVAF